MCQFIIKGIAGNSNIQVGEYYNLLKKINLTTDPIYITDTNLSKIYQDFLADKMVIVIPAGEKFKNLNTVDNIYERLIEMKADRKSFIIGFGGGVVTDTAGFVASTYMRGVDFGFIPTSLLGIIDASIGGKNGVNHKMFKNIIGSINQAKFVYIDPVFLKTLPHEEFINGVSEGIKHYLVADNKGFYKFRENINLYKDKKNNNIKEFLCDQVKIKVDIVNRDEKENGERKKLNFGHTFGHAIEKTAGLKHGFAVSIGMVIAAKISAKLGFLAQKDIDVITETLSLTGLPIESDISPQEIVRAMHKDKKKDGDTIHFIALKHIGKAKILPIKIEELEQLFFSLYQ